MLTTLRHLSLADTMASPIASSAAAALVNDSLDVSFHRAVAVIFPALTTNILIGTVP